MFLFYSEFIFADFKKSTLTEIIYFFTYQYFFLTLTTCDSVADCSVSGNHWKRELLIVSVSKSGGQRLPVLLMKLDP